jgi:hypothetical protein
MPKPRPLFFAFQCRGPTHSNNHAQKPKVDKYQREFDTKIIVFLSNLIQELQLREKVRGLLKRVNSTPILKCQKTQLSHNKTTLEKKGIRTKEKEKRILDERTCWNLEFGIYASAVDGGLT